MKNWLNSLGTYGFLVLVAVITLYPLLWVVGLALGDGQQRGGLNPFNSPPSLDGFEALLSQSGFSQALMNSLVISLAAASLGVLLAATLGYALSRFHFFGRESGLKAIIVSQMFPGVVSSIPIYWLLHHLDLLDSRTGLVLVYATTSVPFCAYAAKGWFDTLPTDLLDAARMDGAGHWRTFWSVALPLAAPALAVTFLFAFMGAWSEFILAQTFLFEESNYTVPMVLQRFTDPHSADWRAFAAGSLIVSAPVLALFYGLQKHLVGGLSAGAVK